MSVLLTIFRHSKFKSDSKRIIRSGHFAEVDEDASRPITEMEMMSTRANLVDGVFCFV